MKKIIATTILVITALTMPLMAGYTEHQTYRNYNGKWEGSDGSELEQNSNGDYTVTRYKPTPFYHQPDYSKGYQDIYNNMANDLNQD